jgi:pimeloyl-ACP methyl ester carboxylesterase
MSDRVSGAPTLETRMDDARAVMDAVGCSRAAFFGSSEGAAMSLLFAATYPERTAALVLRSAYPRTMWAPDYPWGRTEDDYRREVDRDLGLFRSREEALEAVLSRGLQFEDDDEAQQWVSYYRWSGSPGAVEALALMNKDIDVRHVLPAIRVPTLVLHGGQDTIVPIEVARYVADRIPGARLVEVQAGHLATGKAALDMQAGIESFLTEILGGRRLGGNGTRPRARHRPVHGHRLFERKGGLARRSRLARASRAPPRAGPAPARPLSRQGGGHGRRRLLRLFRRTGAGNPLRLRDRRLTPRAWARRPGWTAHGRVRARRGQGGRNRRAHGRESRLARQAG